MRIKVSVYIVIVIILVIVTAFLGVVIGNEESKIASLQGEVNTLRTNYTVLQEQYIQLITNYTNLEAEYGDLVMNYTMLQSQYNELRVNYTSLVDAVYGSLIRIKPVLYSYTNANDDFALFLNITNPTNEPMCITMAVYAGPPIFSELIPSQTVVLVPPRTTVMLPLAIALYNSTRTYFAGYGYLDFKSLNGINFTSELVGMKVSITIINNNLAPAWVMYNTSITEIIPVNKPMGFAKYTVIPYLYCIIYGCGSPINAINLVLENPLPSNVIINGYSVYAYNGSLLTSCKLNKSLIINSTSIINVSLLAQSHRSTSMQLNVIMPLNVVTLTGNWTSLFTSSITCNANHTLPLSIAQLPYGYVVLNTSIGNITIPLLSSYS